MIFHAWLIQYTEVDVGVGGVGAANPRGAGHGAALVEGNELVEVVEVGEHLTIVLVVQ